MHRTGARSEAAEKRLEAKPWILRRRGWGIRPAFGLSKVALGRRRRGSGEGAGCWEESSPWPPPLPQAQFGNVGRVFDVEQLRALISRPDLHSVNIQVFFLPLRVLTEV